MAATILSLPLSISSLPAREESPGALRRKARVIERRPYPGVNARQCSEAENAFRHLTRQQAEALEAIAHAIEYLVDNGLPHRLQFDTILLSNAEAIAILQRAGRGILAQAAARQPWWRRFFGFLPVVTSAVG